MKIVILLSFFLPGLVLFYGARIDFVLKVLFALVYSMGITVLLYLTILVISPAPIGTNLTLTMLFGIMLSIYLRTAVFSEVKREHFPDNKNHQTIKNIVFGCSCLLLGVHLLSTLAAIKISPGVEWDEFVIWNIRGRSIFQTQSLAANVNFLDYPGYPPLWPALLSICWYFDEHCTYFLSPILLMFTVLFCLRWMQERSRSTVFQFLLLGFAPIVYGHFFLWGNSYQLYIPYANVCAGCFFTIGVLCSLSYLETKAPHELLLGALNLAVTVLVRPESLIHVLIFFGLFTPVLVKTFQKAGMGKKIITKRVVQLFCPAGGFWIVWSGYRTLFKLENIGDRYLQRGISETFAMSLSDIVFKIKSIFAYSFTPSRLITPFEKEFCFLLFLVFFILGSGMYFVAKKRAMFPSLFLGVLVFLQISAVMMIYLVTSNVKPIDWWLVTGYWRMTASYMLLLFVFLFETANGIFSRVEQHHGD